MPTEPKPIQAILIIAVLVVAFLAFGVWYWYSTYTKMQEMQSQKQRLEEQYQRLEEIRKKVEEYKRVNQILRERTQVIEDLKHNQAGPVRFMNSFIQAMPEEDPQVWFSKLSHTRDASGDTIDIIGASYDIYALMDFFEQLMNEKERGAFTDVELKYYDKKNIPLRFEIACRKAIVNPAEEGE
jgi:Tfp pilus assembly protein PilN